MKTILPGGTVGVLGGGQLGRMLAMEGRRMGYRVGVLDPTPACPAAQIADFHVRSAFTDAQTIAEFASQADVITVETELIPAEILADVQRRLPTRPSPSVLAIAQDRLRERQFLDKHGFPQVTWAAITDPSGLAQAERQVRFPALLKTGRAGYDGKGQVWIEHAGQLRTAWQEVKNVPSVLESVASFKLELSVVLARNLNGEMRAYPLAENVHRRNILHATRVPARVSDPVRSRAEELAMTIAEILDYCGVMAVEMFVLENDTLLVNEIAPRPHNSGHFTFGACSTSQFEQHLRAICGLPLGEPTLLHPVVMGNLLGELWCNEPPAWDRLLGDPRVRLHLYGKSHPRPGRKMGHFLLFDQDTDRALEQVDAILDDLVSPSSARCRSHDRSSSIENVAPGLS